MEFIFRAILAGVVIGVPAYIVGMMNYSGHKLPRTLMMSVGALSGFAAGLAVLVGEAPWPAVFGISALVACVGAFVTGLSAGIMERVHRRWRNDR